MPTFMINMLRLVQIDVADLNPPSPTATCGGGRRWSELLAIVNDSFMNAKPWVDRHLEDS